MTTYDEIQYFCDAEMTKKRYSSFHFPRKMQSLSNSRARGAQMLAKREYSEVKV